MVINVLGWSDVNFKDPNTGNEIKGKTAYFTLPIEYNGIGEKACKQFVSEKVFGNSKMEIGKFEFTYGYQNKLLSIKKI